MLYLKEWRTAKRVSQEELARLSGIPQGALSVIERGRRDMTLRSLERIAQALGLEITALFRTPLAGFHLDRREKEEIARAIIEGKRPKDPVKDELASDLRSLVSRKLLASKAPGARATRGKRWKVSRRSIDLQRKYGRELVQDILGRTDKLLTQYG
jgi:transcriptional regulator with XRE-family HTH domain